MTFEPRYAVVCPVFKLVLALAIGAGCGDVAAACSVRPGEQLADIKTQVASAVRGSTAVFTGEVTAIDYLRAQPEAGEDRETQVVRVAAQAWWKGDSSPTITLHTHNHRHADGALSVEAHGYRYEVGSTYLIYAQLQDDGLHASSCTRTRKINDAAGDIAMLDALKAEDK